MSGVVHAVGDVFSHEDAKAQADRENSANDKLIQDQELEMQQQQDAVDAQKDAENTSLNQKKIRLAYMQSGGSGFLNPNPISQSSILG